MFQHSVDIPDIATNDWLGSLPPRAVVFALFGRDGGEPYISKTANLRRRLERLLSPAHAGTKRLHLGSKVARLEYSEAASRFATSLLLVRATRVYCGPRAKERLRLRPPALLRLAAENAYPRVYVTNRVIQRALGCTYGPFASRAVAERFLDDSLNFFELRRCTEELHPDPDFPGCVYSEMKMCLAPCFRGCSEERYALETARVREYFASRGATTIARLEKDREEASTALDFETAARIHQLIEKMKTVAQQAAPLVHPLAELDAVIVQPATHAASGPGGVEIFMVQGGRILGPGFYSVEGMRHPNERAGSTSLFAHPTLLEPAPLDTPSVTTGAKATRGVLEERLQTILEGLEAYAGRGKFSTEQLSEHLSLLTRWYYRAPARRVGEIFFRDEAGSLPLSRVLRGISRVFRGQKEAAETTASESVEAPPSGAAAL